MTFDSEVRSPALNPEPITPQHRNLACLLVAVQFLVSVPLVFRWSAVWDEPGHLISGICHWRTQDFRLYSVNPPLARLWATLPVVLTQPIMVTGLRDTDAPFMRLEFAKGAEYFDTQPELALRALRIARFANLVWPLLGTMLMFVMAHRCLGTRAGFIAALLWAFCPLVIGHGVLLPPDIAAAVMVMAVGIIGATVAPPFFAWRAAGVGLVLGAAILTKTTLIILHPVLCIFVLVRWFQTKRFSLACGWIKEILVMTIAVWFVINVGYGWEGFGTRLSDYQFISSRLSGSERDVVQTGNLFRDTLLGSIPVALPENFILGIDTQYKDFEKNFFYPYLLGRWHRDGFLTFYLWYFLLKLPIGFLALAGIGTVATGFRLIIIKNRALFALVTVMGASLFALLSWRTDLNYCQRYAIVCLPTLCLFAGAASVMFKTKSGQMVLWSLVGTTVGVGMWHSPDALSYYNGLVGGPAGGRFSLHGNATDWGQDASSIGRWCQEHPDRRPLSVATVGYPSSLKAFGVQADSIRFEVDTRASWDDSVRGKKVSVVGWHVVSYGHLLDPRSPYHILLHQVPKESLGWTHQVFFIDGPTSKRLQVRSEIELPGEFP